MQVTKKNKSTLMFLGLVGAVGLSLLGLNGVALAGDDAKVYPGTYCRAGNLTNSDVSYSRSGKILNKSTSKRLEVFCPLVRDLSSRDDGLSSVTVFYNNTKPGQKLSCTVATYSPERKRLKTKSKSAPKGKGRFTISYGGNAPTNAYYTMYCSIPTAHGNIRHKQVSSIDSLYVYEHD